MTSQLSVAAALVAMTISVASIPVALNAQTVPRPIAPVRGDTVLRQPSPTASDNSRQRPDSAGKIATGDSLTRFLDKFSYRNLGPAAYSGRVTAIAVPRPYRKTIYIGAAGGGVWKTSNAGITWHPISDSLGVQSIGDIAVAPSDSNVVWVGTGEKNSSRSQSWGNGVHKSINGGRTWKRMGLNDTRSIAKIEISPTDPNTVYVAALGHLWGP
ncbi:MAG: hypothetical protein ABI229_13060, partial [Gemmatimonadaceae bacterium]